MEARSAASAVAGGLGRATAIGMAWLFVQTVGTRAVSLLAQLVVAAILEPQDFGLIGLALTISNIASALVGFGLDQIVLQRQRTLRHWIIPTFYVSLALSIAASLLLVAGAPAAAALYRSPPLIGLITLIAAALPLGALGTVPIILLRNRFDYRTLAAIGFGEALAMQGLVIALALAGFGPYSFAIPIPIVAALRSTALWVAAPVRLRGSLRQVLKGRYLLGSGLAAFLAGVMQSLIESGDYIVLGLVGGTAALGNYFFAFKLASQPIVVLAGNLSSALPPALAQLRGDPTAQGDAAFRAAKLITLIVMPIAMLQAAVIEPAIHFLFGAKWDGAIPLMQILSAALGFDAISYVAWTLLVAQRGFWKQVRLLCFTCPAFYGCVLAGATFGTGLAVAIGVACFYMLVTPIYSYVILKPVGMTPGRLALLYLRPAVLAACAMGASCAAARFLVPDSNLLQIAITCAAGPASYVALLWPVDPAGLRELRTLVERIVGPLASRLGVASG